MHWAPHKNVSYAENSKMCQKILNHALFDGLFTPSCFSTKCDIYVYFSEWILIRYTINASITTYNFHYFGQKTADFNSITYVLFSLHVAWRVKILKYVSVLTRTLCVISRWYVQVYHLSNHRNCLPWSYYTVLCIHYKELGHGLCHVEGLEIRDPSLRMGLYCLQIDDWSLQKWLNGQKLQHCCSEDHVGLHQSRTLKKNRGIY